MTVAMQCMRRGLYVVLITAGLANWLVLSISAMDATYVNAAPITAKPAPKDSLPETNQTACPKAGEAFNRLPLSFEVCLNGSPAPFRARMRGGIVYLSATEALFELSGGEGVKRLDCGADLGTPRNAGSQIAVHKLPGPRRDPAASRALPPAVASPRSHAMRMQLLGGNPHAAITGADKLAARSNYIIGSNPSRWRTGLATYARLQVENVYSGVDLIYYGHQRALEYDFNVAPGASYKAICLRFDGARQLRVDGAGDLLMETTAGAIRQHKPVAYQLIHGVRRAVAARYVVTPNREVRFAIGDYDKQAPLVIDPILSYATYFGGQREDSVYGVAVDGAGNTYITGITNSSDLPSKSAIQSTPGQVYADAFIAKLNAAGTELIYSTYLGGNGVELGNAIAVDGAGNAYVTGSTSSTDFPTTAGGFQPTLANGTGSDAFVVKLKPDGSALSYSTYLGGGTPSFTGYDYGYGIAVDAEGNAYVTGRTDSTNFPTTEGAVQRTLNTLPDAFVSKLNATGTALAYSTYLSGSKSEEGIAIAVDGAGSAYVTGYTSSADFPVTANALQPVFNRDPRIPLEMPDAFVTKVNADGTAWAYSTYLGGIRQEIGFAITVDAAGNAYVAGATSSPNFPTTANALKSEYEGGFYRSGNGGQSWRIRNTGLPVPALQTLAVDPQTPANLYLPTSEGLYKSNDNGNHWARVNSIPLSTLAIDSANPLTLYGGYNSISKSTDGGLTWAGASAGLPAQFFVSRLLIDPSNPLTLYATGTGFVFLEGTNSNPGMPLDQPPPTPRYFFKSTDAGASWQQVSTLLLSQSPSALAIDPQTPARLFINVGGLLYRTQNGGASWQLMNGRIPYAPLVVDPKTTGTLYGIDNGDPAKSTNDGQTWTKIGNGLPLPAGVIHLAAVPTTPTTLYAGTGDGVFKSADAGANWQASGDTSGFTAFVTFNPQDTSMVYTGVDDANDGFVAKLNAAGSALMYSTYLGGRNTEQINDIALDSTGNIYITGITTSSSFPTHFAFQANKPRTVSSNAFLTKLDGADGALLFSTFFGGSIEATGGQTVAVSARGDVYVGGWTTASDLPTENALQTIAPGVSNGFLLKLGAPRITGVSSAGKQLIVSGENFDPGAVLLVNGKAQQTQHQEANPTAVLFSKKGAKKIPVGQSVTLQVRNSDGTLSNAVPFVRSGG